MAQGCLVTLDQGLPKQQLTRKGPLVPLGHPLAQRPPQVRQSRSGRLLPPTAAAALQLPVAAPNMDLQSSPP